jgi:hypothetical protein
MHFFSLLFTDSCVILYFQILDCVQCPTLAILTAAPGLVATHVRYMKKHLELITNKHNFQRIDVKGDHDMHINNAEAIAPYIVSFLTKQQCRL